MKRLFQLWTKLPSFARRSVEVIETGFGHVLLLIICVNTEMMIHENVPVRLINAQLEEQAYRKLHQADSLIRKVDPQVVFKVMTYRYQYGISRKLEEACRYRLDFPKALNILLEVDGQKYPLLIYLGIQR